ncbi:MAG: AmmeMemoRadiSam system protein B [Anaerolinea sp.]|nr:AmmeMemoRadiSam system protein B [Anaerolinea sp.]
MVKIRQPAVAGTFYPAQPARLRQMIEGFLATAVPPKTPIPQPKALIAPHAGYIYSGPIAGSAYACLQQAALTIRRVILLGPAHTMPLRGLAASSATAFAAPFGPTPLDQEAQQLAQTLPQVRVLDEAHHQEHGLEVHLPFLQQVLGATFELVPLVVGSATAVEVAEVLELLWGDDTTLIVISSDLSHYYDYETARRLDRATAQAIETLDADAIGREQACGRIPIQGLLQAAQHHHLRPVTLDLRNSGDTAGSKDRVVGYGAWAFAAS